MNLVERKSGEISEGLNSAEASEVKGSARKNKKASSYGLTVQEAQELLDNRDQRIAELNQRIAEERDRLVSDPMTPDSSKLLSKLKKEIENSSPEEVNNKLIKRKNYIKAQLQLIEEKIKAREGSATAEELVEIEALLGEREIIRKFQWDRNLSNKARVVTLAKEAAGSAADRIGSVASVAASGATKTVSFVSKNALPAAGGVINYAVEGARNLSKFLFGL